jgi:hypothetical protein
MGTVFASDTTLRRWAVDELLECYLSWREEHAAQAYASHIERFRWISE